MIKVVKAKDLIKYLIKAIIPIMIILVILKILLNQTSELAKTSKSNYAFLSCIDDVSEIIKFINKGKEENTTSMKKMIISEMRITDSVVNKQDVVAENKSEEQIEETNNTKQNVTKQEVEHAQTGVKTEVIVGASQKATREYEGVKINSTLDMELTDDLLKYDISVDKSKAVIYHTHTCESYTPTEKYAYTASGNYRTLDLNYSVVRVGDELTRQLESYGTSVIHDKTVHDYPSYNGSYSRSLQSANKDLQECGGADIVIDLHRDAVADASFGPKVKIGDECVSQLMFVIGTRVNGNEYDGWKQNLKYAVAVVKKANELYPGLFRPIMLRRSSYNQHISKAGCIIEVGATGNTLEESMGAMKYLAKVMNEIN